MRYEKYFVWVHSQEREVRHNGQLKYQVFPSQSIFKLALSVSQEKFLIKARTKSFSEE